MSRGAFITLGVALVIGAVGFGVLPALMPVASPIAAYLIAGFCLLLSATCLVPRFREIGSRLIGLTLLGISAATLWGMAGGQIGGWRVRHAAGNEGWRLILLFGLPGAYLVLRGPVTRQLGVLFKSALKRSGVHAFDDLPEGIKLKMEGIPLDAGTWRTIHAEVQAETDRVVPNWLNRAAGLIGIALLFGALSIRAFYQFSMWLIIVLGFVCSVAWGVLFGVILDRRMRSRIKRQTLVKHGYPICIDCGYDLRGLDPGSTCPECGRRTA